MSINVCDPLWRQLNKYWPLAQVDFFSIGVSPIAGNVRSLAQLLAHARTRLPAVGLRVWVDNHGEGEEGHGPVCIACAEMHLEHVAEDIEASKAHAIRLKGRRVRHSGMPGLTYRLCDRDTPAPESVHRARLAYSAAVTGLTKRGYNVIGSEERGGVELVETRAKWVPLCVFCAGSRKAAR